MHQKTSFLLLFGLLLLVFAGSGCQLQEGPGGAASITGRIYAIDYDSELLTYRGEYYAPEEDVYIVYGDNDIFDDDVETHYDGKFRFEFLRKGTYTVFVYSKDSTLTDPSLTYPIKRTVEITKKGQEIDLGTLTIIK